MEVVVHARDRIRIKKKINAVRREGVGQFTGLPLWRAWSRKEGYLPLILSLASEVGFCLSKYRRRDTRFCRVCMLCRWSLCRQGQEPSLAYPVIQ